jgi:hypothetical protein
MIFNNIYLEDGAIENLEKIKYILNFIEPQDKLKISRINIIKNHLMTIYWMQEYIFDKDYFEKQSIEKENQIEWDCYVENLFENKYEYISNYNIRNTRNINHETRYEVIKRQKWKCNNCSEKLKFNKNSPWEGEVAHIDHIHPFSKRYNYPGYINELNNLQALCPKCNILKSKN